MRRAIAVLVVVLTAALAAGCAEEAGENPLAGGASMSEGYPWSGRSGPTATSWRR